MTNGQFGFETLAVRAGTQRSQFNEHSEAMYLTSSFVFHDAAEAARRFSGEEEGMVYSRYTNPTVQMLETRLAALEGAESCVSTASGMSAILAAIMSLMKAGEHIVASRSVFGATIQLFNNVLQRFGVETTFVEPTKMDHWTAAIRPNTRLLFVETPSNPLTEVVDIRALSDVAHEAGALLVVDNCFCTPALQRPIEHGADVVIHSATKYLDGQGRVLGGAVLGRSDVIRAPLTSFLRSAGPVLSPFNAWVILKGLETLKLRMDAHCKAAHETAMWLEQHPRVSRVFYPGLESNPDATRLISITANLGDAKSTITHPASTTHGRLSADVRAAAGISEGLLRVAVGLEAVDDIKADLDRGLARI
jgi:O-succinylhomoserine sulfhydrylase